MIDKICAIIESNITNDGRNESQISWLNFYHQSKVDDGRQYGFYRPSLCIALRGAKQVSFGRHKFVYDNEHFVLAPSKVSAKLQVIKAPLLAIVLDFTQGEILDVARHAGLEFVPSTELHGLKILDQTDEILDALYRLIILKDEAKAHLVKKEILHILLSGKGGAYLHSYVQNGTTQNAIVRAIDEIVKNFDEPLNMETLADKVGLSASSFYANFKSITKQTPLNFLKQIRLENAKNMLLIGDDDVHSVAIRVGYESPNQFSREYARMFGAPPRKHINTLKQSGVVFD